MVNSITATKVDIAEFLANGANSIMVKSPVRWPGRLPRLIPITWRWPHCPSRPIPSSGGHSTLEQFLFPSTSPEMWTRHSKSLLRERTTPRGTNKCWETLSIRNRPEFLHWPPRTDRCIQIIRLPWKLRWHHQNQTVSFNIMCASEGEQVKLMCVNNLSEKASTGRTINFLNTPFMTVTLQLQAVYSP